MHSDENVLDRGHLREEANVLERPPDTELDDRVRGLADDLGPVEDDGPGGRNVDTGDLVEERRLAGAVRPDQRDDRTARNGEVDVVRRHEPAELLPHRVGDEQVVDGGRHQSSLLSRSVSVPSVCTS